MFIITDASYKKPDKGIIAFLVGETATRTQVKAKSSTHAELLSIKMALEFLVKQNVKNAVVVNDCKPVVDGINGKVAVAEDVTVMVKEIRLLMQSTKARLEWKPRKDTIIPDLLCSLPNQAPDKVKFKTISLPKLDRLEPTVISTAIKLSEEVGELNQIIGKMQGMAGEKSLPNEFELYRKIGRELLDVAQTCITFMFVLEEKYGVSIDTLIKEHLNKLRQKGYMS